MERWYPEYVIAYGDHLGDGLHKYKIENLPDVINERDLLWFLFNEIEELSINKDQYNEFITDNVNPINYICPKKLKIHGYTITKDLETITRNNIRLYNPFPFLQGMQFEYYADTINATPDISFTY